MTKQAIKIDAVEPTSPIDSYAEYRRQTIEAGGVYLTREDWLMTRVTELETQLVATRDRANLYAVQLNAKNKELEALAARAETAEARLQNEVNQHAQTKRDLYSVGAQVNLAEKTIDRLRDSWNQSKADAARYWNTYEKFMVAICKALNIRYEDTSQADVLIAIKSQHKEAEQEVQRANDLERQLAAANARADKAEADAAALSEAREEIGYELNNALNRLINIASSGAIPDDITKAITHFQRVLQNNWQAPLNFEELVKLWRVMVEWCKNFDALAKALKGTDE